MSTPNFRTQRDFDLYLYDGSATDEQIKEVREMNNYDESISDDTIYQWVTEDNYNIVIEDFKYNLQEVFKELKRELQFYTIELKDGHYIGLQFYVKLDSNLYGCGSKCVEDVLNWIDNEDTKYYYDMCLSQFKVKFLSEVKYINKKVLPLLAKYTGFEQYNCVGIFSNGEAIYTKATQTVKKVA